MKSIVNSVLTRVSCSRITVGALSLAIARNLKFRHMHPFVQIQVVNVYVMYPSYLINTIGSVIEPVSVYWHKQFHHLRQLFFFNNIAAS